jgi:uncharacterized pyridoxal phosphate-containing UPF0001 family protein
MSRLRESLQANLDRVHERITKAARGAGRLESEVALVAVSKAFPGEAVLAAVGCGQRDFGENYVRSHRQDRSCRQAAPDAGSMAFHRADPEQ